MSTSTRSLLLVSALAVAATACGGDGDSPASTTTASTVPATTEPAGDAATEESTVPDASDAPGTTAATTDAPVTTVPATTMPTTDAPATTTPDETIPDDTVPTTDGSVESDDAEITTCSIAAGESARVELPLGDGESLRFRVEGSPDADLVVAVIWDERGFISGLHDHPALVEQVGLPTDLTLDELIAEVRNEGFFTDPVELFSDNVLASINDGEIVVESVDYAFEGDPEATYEFGLGPGPVTLVIFEYDGKATDYRLVVERGPSIDFDDPLALGVLESDPFFDQSQPFYGS